MFRVNQRDTTQGLIHEVEPSEVRFLGRDMAAVEGEFNEALPELSIPASGEAYDDCGEEQPLQFCDRCGKPKRIPRRCRMAICPECWESWVGKQTVEIASKINGRQRYENIGDGRWWKMHHVTVSPPPGYEMRSGEPLDRTKEVVKQIMAEGGGFEGAIIYHPWRIKEEHRGTVLGHESGKGDLRWRHILHLVEVAGWEPVRDEFLTFAPHFHVFTPSHYFKLDTKGLQRRTGWLVERISDDSGASVRELPDLCAAVAYSLSHAGGRPGHDRYWYFGETANFEPTEGVKSDTKAALATVSERVLGVGVGGTGRCDQDLAELVEANDGAALNAPTGGGGAPPPEMEIEAEEEPDDRCRGKLAQMGEAPEYLGDEDWRQGAPYADELAVAHTEYRAIEAARDRPPPEPPPA